jgi:hypothetical protein
MKSLQQFNNLQFIPALKLFFEELKVPVSYFSDTPASPKAVLEDKYQPENPAHALIEDVFVLGIVNDDVFEGKNTYKSLAALKTLKKDYDGLVILGVTLKSRENNYPPSRSQLAKITRSLNQVFPYFPVNVVFKYDGLLTFANSQRTEYRQEWREGEKIGKITMLKDVKISNPHTAHLKILSSMSIEDKNIDSFEKLYQYWQSVFSIQELNKSFFKDLSNWYFYSQNYIKFPNEQLIDGKVIPEAQNKQMNLIRLITRLIFVWFLKERKLVNNNIFDLEYVAEIVKDFNPRNKKAANYYPAILQNLFFATLNQKMTERSFVENTKKFNKEDQGVKTLYRYAEKFNIPEKEVISLFRDIPFLNGGLFDCLDRYDEEKLAKGKKDQVFIDGFTRKDEKIPIVPDFLFYGEERIVDLTEYYGAKKEKETFQGIINIFNKYKFTIEENTPIEEEIALDPELLGKVFENLLAYYNPETESTARKQTGSFYTPREIVNYMVDESLIAYLKTQLLNVPETFIEFGRNQTKLFGNEYKGGTLLATIEGSPWKTKEEELETAIRDLISYNEKPHPFNKSEVQQLIFAIDNCKILDPACGSGAFPMGMLHKLVHILAKLDPEDESGNTFWRTLQKQKAEIAISQALDDKDKKLREIKLHEINETFEKNSSDYGRKLYLIENCIYGVDIQTIAVQISKLRFFISLIVDQKEHSNEDNRGIRPLPNLETKFVAANTLIGLDIQTHTLFSEDNPVNLLQNKLKEVRHKYFEAKSRKEKLQFQEDDKKLRKELSEKIKALLVQNNKDEINKLQDKLKNEKIKLIQIQTSKEDVEILETTNLFGQIERTRIDKKQDKVKAQKGLINIIEETLAEKKDSSYKDTVINMASKIASFNPYDQNKSADWFEPEWMFGLSSGFNIVIGNPPYGFRTVLSKEDKIYFRTIKNIEFRSGDSAELFCKISFNSFVKTSGILTFIIPKKSLYGDAWEDLRNSFWSKYNLAFILDTGKSFDNVLLEASVFGLIKENSKDRIDLSVLGVDLSINHITRAKKAAIFVKNNTCQIYRVIFPEKMLIDITNHSYDEKIINTQLGLAIGQDFFSENNTKYKLLKGIDIEQYRICSHRYLRNFTKLKQSNIEMFLKPKIIAQRIVAHIENPNPHLKITACYDEEGIVITNTLMAFYPVKEILPKYLLGYLNSTFASWYSYNLIYARAIRTMDFYDFYIQQLPIPKASSDMQIIVSNMVDYIIILKQLTRDTTLFERLIDVIIYGLFFAESFQNINILNYLNDIPNIQDLSKANKLIAIERMYKELSVPSNPLNKALSKIQEIQEVKIIESRN